MRPADSRVDDARGAPPEPADGDAAIQQQIARLVTEHFDWVPGDGTAERADARLRDDLDLDSLHLVELQVAVEDHFGVIFDPSDEQLIDAFDTIASLGEYVDFLLRKGS